MVGGLAGLGVALGGVADDAERGLVGGDDHLGDVAAARVVEKRGGLVDEVEHALERAGGLVLVKAELEVHAHDGEVVAAFAQDQIKWGCVGGGGCQM